MKFLNLIYPNKYFLYNFNFGTFKKSMATRMDKFAAFILVELVCMWRWLSVFNNEHLLCVSNLIFGFKCPLKEFYCICWTTFFEVCCLDLVGVKLRAWFSLFSSCRGDITDLWWIFKKHISRFSFWCSYLNKLILGRHAICSPYLASCIQ